MQSIGLLPFGTAPDKIVRGRRRETCVLLAGFANELVVGFHWFELLGRNYFPGFASRYLATIASSVRWPSASTAVISAKICSRCCGVMVPFAPISSSAIAPP